MAIKITDEADVFARRDALLARRLRVRDVQRELDHWRAMCEPELEPIIWHDNPENAKRRLKVTPFIAAVTDTVIAFLSGDRPKITAQAKDSTSQPAADAANAVERVATGTYDTLNKDRDAPIEMQVADHCVHRGEMVSKFTSLSPEERGEERYEPEPALEIPFGEPVVPEFEITKEGKFPILWQVLDPFECYWNTGKDDRVIEFIHEYTTTWDRLCDEFPDLYDNADYAGQLSPDNAHETVTVIDYWNEEINCILFDTMHSKSRDAQHFYKPPTKHHYPFVPVRVDIAKPVEDATGPGKTRMRRGQPFCEKMLGPARQLSYQNSLSITYLEHGVFQAIAHEGVDPNTSPYMGVDEKTGEGVYQLEQDNSPGAPVLVGFNQERFRPIPPAPLVPALQEAKMVSEADLELVSLSRAIITGNVPGPPSGYAYFQMKQAPMARIGPYELALDRHISAGMQMVIDLIVHDWDRLDYPMVLTRLSGQTNSSEEQIAVTREDFAQIGTIKAKVKVSLPVDKEAESAAIIQQMTMGLMHPVTAIDKLQEVQDAHNEYQAAIAHNFIMTSPEMQASIAMAWLKKQGITPLQPQPPPVPPGMPGALPPGAPPQGGPEMAAMPGSGPLPPGPPVDPLMAMMGGGMPPPMGPPPMGPEMGGGAPPMPPEQLLAMLQGG